MGRRHERHSFMPGKFVFPGGAVDEADARVRPAVDLEPSTLAKLMLRMRGRPSARRARALAMAAVRETFEETGLILGRPARSTGVTIGGLATLSRSGLRSGFYRNWPLSPEPSRRPAARDDMTRDSFWLMRATWQISMHPRVAPTTSCLRRTGFPSPKRLRSIFHPSPAKY